MQIIKLHEATKQFKIQNKLAMFFLEKKNVPVKSHSSVITMEQLVKLREFAENQDKFKDIVEEFDRLESSRKHQPKPIKEKGKAEDGAGEDIAVTETSPEPVEVAAVAPEPPPADIIPAEVVQIKPAPPVEVKPPAPPAPEEPVRPEPPQTPIAQTTPREPAPPAEPPRVEKPMSAPPKTESQTPAKPQFAPPAQERRPPEHRGDRPRHEARPQEQRPQHPRTENRRPEQRPDQRPMEQRSDQRGDQQRPDRRPDQRGDQQRPDRRPDQRGDQQRPDRRPDQRGDQQRPDRRPDQRGDQQRPDRRPDQRGDQQRPDRRPDQRGDQYRPDRRPDFRNDQPRPEGQRPRPEGGRPPYPRNDASRPQRPDQRPEFKRPRPEFNRPPAPAVAIDAEKPRRMDPSRKVQIDAAKKERDFVSKKVGDFDEKAGKKVKKGPAAKSAKWKIETDQFEPGEELIADASTPAPKKAKKEWNERRPGKDIPPQPQVPAPRPKPKVRVYQLPELIQIPNFITLKELAEKLNLKLRDIEDRKGDLIKQLATNQLLEEEHIRAICEEFKVEADIVPYEDFLHYEYIAKYKAELAGRAPVVTVMGHVDHGKTTLLDTLRNTRVADREAGGITQKIGAYRISLKGNEIVFIDTPGHEAFTNIRARGAKVTDIVILVVAANDGVQPQTIEAINHARAADVPIIVAINKIDLPGADPSRVKQNLTKHNLIVEDWGGDVVSVEISAKHNQNLDALLEMVSLVAEMLELKAYDKVPARGAIIESRLDPKLGPMGTVLLQHGAVKQGDFFICGNSIGKVKSIFDDRGAVIKSAHVPMPVEIMGFDQVPEAGELFQVADDVDKARKVIEMRQIQVKDAKNVEALAEKKLSLQNLFEKLEENKTKTFNIIIKTDNFSSCEVLESILLKQDTGKVKINIVHKSIGNITESDILLASTSNSIILGFNVKAPQKILVLAKREQIEVRLYNVIYHLIEEVEKALRGEIEPEYIENRIGRLEVLQTFKISHVGLIAGCIVREGKVTNKSKLKVFRNDDLVFEGELETLRRVKNEASEVNAGTECGVKIKNFNAIEVGDILESYELKLK